MTKDSPFTAVIFDVGGVLAHPAEDQFGDDFFGSRDHDSDHPWHQWERGELTVKEAAVLLDLGSAEPRPPRPYILDEDYVGLAEQLAEAGLRLALCTNTPLEASPLWQSLYPWGEIFDVIIRSCDIGARKPDVRMVQAALSQLGCEPERALFVDDLPANRSAAEEIGVTTVDGGSAEGISRIRSLIGLDGDAARKHVGYRGPQRPRIRNRADELLAKVLFEPEHKVDPFPLFKELRDLSPLHRLSEKPIWYATTYEDCRQVLRHPDFVKADDYLSVDTITGEPVLPPPPNVALPLAFIDPPAHSRVRGVMHAGFTKARVEGWRPQLEDLAARLVSEAVARSEVDQGVDVVEAIAYPMAQHVICDLVGVPHGERDGFRHLMQSAADVFEPGLPPVRTYEAVMSVIQMTEFLTKMGDSSEGLLSDLLDEARRVGNVSDEEVVSNVTFMFFAGFETVAHLISNTLYMMSRHPDQYTRLVASPDLAPSAAIEVGRYHSPVQTNSRGARRDLELGGTLIPEGGVVVTLLGAANRDPAAFEDPDRFDIGREGPGPLTFGAGIHYCLGAQLAAMEATLVLQHLVAVGVQRIRQRDAVWKQAIVLRGFERLEVAFDCTG